jgi:Rrf2 family protein
MKSDFAIALHVMGFLTARQGKPLSSEILARSYGTNPVVIRRVLSKLQAGALISSQRGLGGGSVLAQDPSQVTLRRVYEAVNGEPEFLPRYRGDGSEVADVMGRYIDGLSRKAEDALMAHLESISIAEMDAEVRPIICASLEKE